MARTTSTAVSWTYDEETGVSTADMADGSRFISYHGLTGDESGLWMLRHRAGEGQPWRTIGGYGTLGELIEHAAYLKAAPTGKLHRLVQQFHLGEIDKWDFYGDSMGYSAQKVADASGISLGVVEDRRRYMRQLAKSVSAGIGK